VKPGPAPTLREARLSDAAAVRRLTRAAYEEHRELLDPPSGVHSETARAVERFLRLGGAMLALTDGETVGAVRYSRSDDDAIWLGRLAVLPSHRRRGIGRALVAAVEEKARRMGARRVTLGVRVQLPGNRALFESLGYRVDGERSHPGHDRTTWLHMSKAL
jgi:predicted N-acetyltransferase YhbS